jgi:hypothetical protein
MTIQTQEVASIDNGVKQMTESERNFKIAAVFERKANEAASSDAPWAMGNLRTYQNMMSKHLMLAYAAEAKGV